MPRYEWTGDGEFRDGRNDRTVEPGDVIELDEHVGEPNDELVRVDEDEPESVGDDEPDEEPTGEAEDEPEEDEDICGYYDEETMDGPCQRDAGWGRDADTGRCTDHADED